MMYLKAEEFDKVMRAVGLALIELRDESGRKFPTPLPDERFVENAVRGLLTTLTGYNVLPADLRDIGMPGKFEPGIFPNPSPRIDAIPCKSDYFSTEKKTK